MGGKCAQSPQFKAFLFDIGNVHAAQALGFDAVLFNGMDD